MGCAVNKSRNYTGLARLRRPPYPAGDSICHILCVDPAVAGAVSHRLWVPQRPTSCTLFKASGVEHDKIDDCEPSNRSDEHSDDRQHSNRKRRETSPQTRPVAPVAVRWLLGPALLYALYLARSLLVPVVGAWVVALASSLSRRRA